MNRILQILRDGFRQNLVHVEMTTDPIPPGGTLNVDVPLGKNKVMINIVEVTARKSLDLRVEFFETAARIPIKSRYNSGDIDTRVYDNPDIIYIDKENNGMLYMTITNLSDTFDCQYDIDIRGLELR